MSAKYQISLLSLQERPTCLRVIVAMAYLHGASCMDFGVQNVQVHVLLFRTNHMDLPIS
jgi:hypothetical protein